MDLGSGRESGDQQQLQQQQQQQQQHPQQQVQQQPAQPQPLAVSLLMPAQLQATNFHAATTTTTTTTAPPQQQQQLQHHHHHHEMAVPKLKLLSTPSGNGGSVLAAKGDQHIDQAREILRQAVVAVTEAGATKAAAATTVKKGTVRYRECQKNHAASIGGHAIDGCGEFMPGGEDGSMDALRCAACDCHRNFHRREVEGEVLCDCKRNPKPNKPLPPGTMLITTPPGAINPQHQQQQPTTPVTTLGLPTPLTMAALSAGNPTDSDDQDDGPGNSMMMSMRSPSAIKKRFRTKFTTEQKDQMCLFAEKVGWRIQKHDEAAVQEFCTNVGVKRHVLKVWMHNNKHTMGKKP